jgi:hypothetical protein
MTIQHKLDRTIAVLEGEAKMLEAHAEKLSIMARQLADPELQREIMKLSHEETETPPNGYGKGKHPITNVIDAGAQWLHENNLGKYINPAVPVAAAPAPTPVITLVPVQATAPQPAPASAPVVTPARVQAKDPASAPVCLATTVYSNGQ